MLPTEIEILPNHHRLRVARLGNVDAPPLILLHGYPDNLQIWCELAPRLADMRRVIAFDWPGMGQSEAWPGGATPMLMAERLLALLDAWHIERADITGIDMGGQPALVFAARHPERIGKLIVMNSLVFPDSATSWEIRVLRRFGCNRFIIRNLPGLVFRRANKTFLPRGVHLPAPLYDDLWQSFRQPAVRAYISKMCAGFQGTLPQLPEMYRQIQCQTLVLWAERDKHFPPAHAERLHRTIAGSRLEILTGGEHWMPWHLAEEVATCVRDFLH
jgi:pimeloyl-ACP methyl ester carboxylesterase